MTNETIINIENITLKATRERYTTYFDFRSSEVEGCPSSTIKEAWNSFLYALESAAFNNLKHGL
jgi:hypothetical protein